MVNKEMLQLGTARSVIRELFEFGKERAKVVGEENVFDFSLGNPNSTPPEIVQTTAEKLLKEKNIHGYTSAAGDMSVREKLTEDISRRFGRNYRPEEIYVTVGAAAGLCCLVRALACPDDEFLIFAPYFPEYTVFINSNGGKCVTLPPIDGFQPNLKSLEQSITKKTKAVLINSPNNPSGVVYTRESLEKLGEILRRKSEEFQTNIYLISDEPYRELVYDGESVPWVPDFYDNTIICYSFSKSLALAGERIGYILVGDHVKDSSNVFGAVAGAGRSLGYVNAPSLFQHVVANCGESTSDLAVYQRNRDILTKHLQKCGFTLPEKGGAFYLFPKALEEDDVAFCERAKSFDLLLVSGSAFGAKGYFRLAYCVSEEKVLASLNKWTELAQSYGF